MFAHFISQRSTVSLAGLAVVASALLVSTAHAARTAPQTGSRDVSRSDEHIRTYRYTARALIEGEYGVPQWSPPFSGEVRARNLAEAQQAAAQRGIMIASPYRRVFQVTVHFTMIR